MRFTLISSQPTFHRAPSRLFEANPTNATCLLSDEMFRNVNAHVPPAASACRALHCRSLTPDDERACYQPRLRTGQWRVAGPELPVV